MQGFGIGKKKKTKKVEKKGLKKENSYLF